MTKRLYEDEDYGSEWYPPPPPDVEVEDGELPDDDGDGAVVPTSTPLRLVAYHSTQNPASDLLPARQTVAYIDSTTTIGRDKSYDPRIRLKSLEVSKAHATLFYDDHAGSWSIVDTASTHGTFVKSNANSKSNTREEQEQGWSRLADKGKASLPRRLNHLDTIKVASQRFIVHLHSPVEEPQGCLECAHFVYPDGSDNLVPLLNSEPAGHAQQQQQQQQQQYGKSMLNAAGDVVYETVPSSSSSEAFASIRSKEEKQIDFKKDLKSLRRQMLFGGQQASASPARQPFTTNKKKVKVAADATATDASTPSAVGDVAEPSVSQSQPAYIDRAKLRRSLHPATESDSQPLRSVGSKTHGASPAVFAAGPVLVAEPSYGPGQALYQKMVAGSSSSSSSSIGTFATQDIKAVEPQGLPLQVPPMRVMGEVIQVRTSQTRNAGLGHGELVHGELVHGVENIGGAAAAAPQSSRMDWRTKARDRRWQEVQQRQGQGQ